MNPQCASCNKTVYPVEKLNCLDKFWHKGCFRCVACGMTLNMKNYKGYEKMPYCSAHYPTTKFTAVADTPENRRLSENTKKQSNLEYHAEFERMKGKKESVADDLETMRASKSAQIASNLAYHGVQQRRELQEMHRPDQVIEDERRNPRHRAVGRISDYDPAENQSSPYSARSQMPTIYDSNKGGRVEEPAGPRRVGKISDYDPEQNQWGTIGQGFEERVPGRFEPTNQYNPKPASAPGYRAAPQHTWQPPSKTRQMQREKRIKQQQLVEQQLAQQQQKQQQLLAQQQQRAQQQQQAVPQMYAYGAQPGFEQQGYKKPGSYHAPQNPATSPSWNAQPAPGYGQIFSQPGRDPQAPWPSRQVPQQYRNSGPVEPMGPPQSVPPPQSMPPPPAQTGSRIRYRAVYDYNAADDDEISFSEGDIIVDSTVIDEGWMEGRNQRTGQYGMLPSNYVEKV